MSNIFQGNKGRNGKALSYFQSPNAVVADGLLSGMKECAIKLYLAILYKSNKNTVVDVLLSDEDIKVMTDLAPGSVKTGREMLQSLGLVHSKKAGNRGYLYTILNPETGSSVRNYQKDGGGAGFVDLLTWTPEQFRVYYEHRLPGPNTQVAKDGSQLYACCPFHDDSNASLSVGLDEGGGWTCHGPCKRSGDILDFEIRIASVQGAQIDRSEGYRRVVEIVRKKGLLSDSALRRTPKPDEVYEYTSLAGDEVLFEICRFNLTNGKKRFIARRPHPIKPDEYVYDIDGVDPVPFKLRDVDDASQIIIVEGEKDVNAVCRLNLHDPFGLPIACTTNPFGAGKWRDSYSEHLIGKQVVILPDQDEPGIKHAKQVEQSLKRVAGVDAKIVDLPLPKVKMKMCGGIPKDVSDFLILNPREALIPVIGKDWFDADHPFGIQI
jgi:5S rRNA maturation endonuclease (ribonuclease M5)